MYKAIIIPLLTLYPLVMSASNLPPESNRMQPGHLPTPFSAEELKAFNVPGYVTKYRIEGQGMDPMVQMTEWLPSEDGGAVFQAQGYDLAGQKKGEKQSARADWKELQAHASFPADISTVSEETIEVPAGTFACWRYEVTREVSNELGEPADLVMTFWFAKELPGPPVRMIQKLGDNTRMQMILLEYTREGISQD